MAVLLINGLVTIALLGGTAFICSKYKVHKKIYNYGKTLVDDFKKGYNENPNSDLVVRVKETLEGMGHGIGTFTVFVTDTYGKIALGVNRVLKYFNRNKDFIKDIDNDYKHKTRDLDCWEDVRFFGKHIYNDIEFYIGKNKLNEIVLKAKADSLKELHDPKILQHLYIDNEGNVWINSRKEIKSNTVDGKIKDFKFSMFDAVIKSYAEKSRPEKKIEVDVNKTKKSMKDMDIF